MDLQCEVMAIRYIHFYEPWALGDGKIEFICNFERYGAAYIAYPLNISDN